MGIETKKPRANGVVITTVVQGTDGRKPVMVFAIENEGRAELDLNLVAQPIIEHAALHGLKQRVSDAAAMSRSPKTGLSASPRDKLEAMREVVEHYNSGTTEWRLKGTERIGNDEVLLARALAEVYPERDAAKIRAYVGGLKKAERTALLAIDKIKVVADRMRSAEVKDAGVNAEELLMGLETMPE